MSVKRVRGPGQRYQMDRGAMLALRGSANVHVLVNQENGVYVPALVNFSLYPLKRRKGRDCLYLGFMQVLCVDAVSGSALSVTDSNRTCQCPACVSLGYILSFATFWTCWSGLQWPGRTKSQAWSCGRWFPLLTHPLTPSYLLDLGAWSYGSLASVGLPNSALPNTYIKHQYGLINPPASCSLRGPHRSSHSRRQTNLPSPEALPLPLPTICTLLGKPYDTLVICQQY